jgi:hypothetical protein
MEKDLSVRWRTILLLFLSFLFFGLLSACDFQKVQKDFLSYLPFTITWKKDQTSPKKSEAEDSEKDFQRSAEIFREMYTVVYIEEPKDRSDFVRWANALNQGASLEGVYNGLVHSTNYQRLEALPSSASPGALKVFGEEFAFLVQEHQAASPAPTLQTLSEGASKQYVGASIYTLKRVLGDEALLLVASKNEFRERLAFWYSKWVVRMTQRNIDFGLALRNKPDEAFHYKWALNTSEDRIKWEILNRLHRVLNEVNQQK